MIFLLLHIVGNTAFLLAVRVARQQPHYLLIGTVNYATGFVLASIVLAQSAVNPSWQSLSLGAIQGFQYQTMFLLLFVLLRWRGVAVVVALLRLSVIIPTLASILIWREYPNSWQAVGLCLAALALPLLSGGGTKAEPGAHETSSTANNFHNSLLGRARRMAFVSCVILLGGMGLLAAKAFAEIGRPDQRPVYNFGIFATATVLSAISWPFRDRFAEPLKQPAPLKGGGMDPVRFSLLLGVVTGITNIVQVELLLRALTTVSGTIAFPLTAAATQLLTAAAGWFFWKEPLRGRTAVGVALGLVSAILMNAP